MYSKDQSSIKSKDEGVFVAVCSEHALHMIDVPADNCKSIFVSVITGSLSFVVGGVHVSPAFVVNTYLDLFSSLQFTCDRFSNNKLRVTNFNLASLA